MEKIPKMVHSSWHPYLQPLFNDDRMKFIKYNLLNKCHFLPSSENIFRVFSMPLKEIEVVILGQDPYPKKDSAIGYAFAVNKHTSIPYSLATIAREIEREGIGIDYWNTEWRTLKHWTKQGILLLNTALTVEEGNAGRHLKHWRWFTEEIVKIISREVTPIWLLWGSKAQGFQSIIRNAETFLVNDILLAPHPASEAYGKTGFYGCNHFNKINNILRSKNKPNINF